MGRSVGWGKGGGKKENGSGGRGIEKEKKKRRKIWKQEENQGLTKG